MANTVLVTGAAGFIGRHIALACATAGWEVTSVDCREAPLDVQQHTRFLRADFADPAVIRQVDAGVFAGVLHQAAISSTLETDWSLLEATNVRTALDLARASIRAGTRFVYASSSSVYGRVTSRAPVPEDAVDARDACSGPLNLYAHSKLALDRIMVETFMSSADWVGLRYTNVFGAGESHKGPMASIISQLLRKTATSQPIELFADTLEACRDYVPVRTVADTYLRLLQTAVPAGVYNLGAGHAVSFATLLEWCTVLSDSDQLEVRLIPNPISERYQYWTCADMAKLISALPGYAVPTTADIRTAASALYEGFLLASSPSVIHAARHGAAEG